MRLRTEERVEAHAGRATLERVGSSISPRGGIERNLSNDPRAGDERPKILPVYSDP